MKIVLRWTWTVRRSGGVGLGVSFLFPSRCAEVQGGIPGTVSAAGIGFGLLVARLYIDATWDFRPFNP